MTTVQHDHSYLFYGERKQSQQEVAFTRAEILAARAESPDVPTARPLAHRVKGVRGE